MSVFDRPMHVDRHHGGHMARHTHEHWLRRTARTGLSLASKVAWKHAIERWRERKQIRPHKRHKHENSEQRIRGDDNIQGISSDKLTVWVNKPLRHKFIKTSYCRTHDQYEVSATTPSGGQNSFSILHIGSMYDILGTDATGATGPFQLPVSLHHVIPDVAMPAQAFWGANNDPLTQKLAIKHVELECDFVNPCNYPVVADVYFFKAKKLIPSTPTSATTYNLGDIVSIWGRAGQMLSQGKGPQTFTTGYGAGGLGYQAINDPGAKPTNNSEFNKWYELVGSHSMNLGPGAVEKLNVNIHMNMAIDLSKVIQAYGQNPTSSVLNQASNAYSAGLMRGGLQGFVIFRGTPAKDSTVGNSGRFTYSPAELGCLVQRKISYVGIPVNQKNYPALLAKDNLAYGIADTSLGVMANSNISAQQTKEA